MRFIIYGAGAIGSLMGAYLARSGFESILVGRDKHVNRINNQGLKVITDKGQFTVAIPAISNLSQIKSQPGDVVFITLKSQDTAASLEALSQNLARNIPIFCFQNGIRNESLVKTQFTRVYGGVVFFSGTCLNAGEVSHTRYDKVGFGVYPEGLDETTQQVYQALSKAGLDPFQHGHIMSVKWSKLAINLSMAINAVTGLSGAETLQDDDARRLISDMTDEGLKVIKAAGIVLADATGRPTLARHIAGLKSSARSVPAPAIPEGLKHRPSIWQDIYLKRGETEIDFLNGEIIQLGKKVHIPTPLNSFIVDLLKELAGKGDPTVRYDPRTLRRMAEKEI